MIAQMERLTDGVVTLVPITDNRSDMNYLFNLMPKYRFNIGDRAGKEKLTYKYGKHFWVGRTESFVGSVRGGVIYLCYLPEYGIWTLDAYRDDELMRALNRRGDYSLRSGKLVIDWFFKTYKRDLFTVHDVRSRAATIVCRRLGFSKKTICDTPCGKFLIMQKKYKGD